MDRNAVPNRKAVPDRNAVLDRHAVLDVDDMRAAAGEATALLRVLANEDRLLLLCELNQGERCVSELEERLDIHQPTLSQQLGVLRSEGLVATRREGKRIYYRVSEPRAIPVLRTLYALYCGKPGPAAGSGGPRRGRVASGCRR
jgi:ArsR family transcriptional regulator